MNPPSSDAPGAPERVRIALGARSYEILIGAGLLDRPESFGAASSRATAVIVTNPTVAPLYAARLEAALGDRHARVLTLGLPDGEAHKDWPALTMIFDALLAEGCDRKTVLYALGGGVIGDMTGFAAACYMRGIDYVQVPTTLLAQVDSSVGGKTAINHPLGKNMIGAFHQPIHVVADLDTLDTLPTREFAAGLAEVIKYGPIADEAFFGWLEANLDRLLARDKPALAYAVRRSCEIKAAVVAADEREADVRAILNFGHTFGHAIETGLGHGAWLHGEAVGCGMVMAADLSHRLRLIDGHCVDRLVALIERAGLPTRGPRFGVDRYLELMQVDKKAEGGAIRFVLLDGPARAVLRSADVSLVAATLDACCA